MVKITVRYFAAVRERLGLEREELELPTGTDVSGLWEVLCQLHPELDSLRKHIRLSVALEFADDNQTLTDGDEVALIPPVAGGTDASTLLSAEPLDVAAVRATVERPEAGAVVVFEGVVRNHSKGREVAYLEYEAYPEMASAKLRQVIDEVEEQWSQVQCAIVHRFGRLQVGDLAVVIAVSSPHREAAFEACSQAIARIKEIVPIWKREVGPDGEEWVGMGS